MKTKYLPSLLILISLLFTNQSIAQSNKLVIEKMKIPDANAPQIHSNENYNSPAMSPGEEIFNTNNDYMCNNAIGSQIDLVDLDGDGVLDPIITQMQRLSSFPNRSQRFAYQAFGAPIVHFNAFDSTSATSGSATYGFGSIQLCVGGDWDGNALLFAHSNGLSWHSRIDLANLVPITPYPTTSSPGSFPSFVYLQSGRIIVNNSTLVYYSSTDYGETFDSLFRFGDSQPNFNFNTSNTPSEIPIFKSDDDTVIASVAGFDGCFPTGNPDGFYWYGSTDAGNTWFGYAFGYGSGANPEYGQIINRDYAPYFSNFAQINYNVSNDGVTHVVANGYGQGVLPGTTDTVNVFPILYWNSRDQNWIAITDPSTEGPTDGFGNYVTGGSTVRLYSGNAIGQAYPNITTSDDGKLIVAAWQGFEYTGAVGNSEWNIYPGDGSSNSGPIYYTDLYFNYSTDYGVTWVSPEILKGDANVMEQFPYLSRRMEFDGTTYKAHFIYQEDAIPGCSIFNGQIAGQNSASDDTRWLYDSFFPFPTGDVNDNSMVNNFSLEQNYPNPFNPSTKISWQSAVGSWQTLKVYDVLGNEVATLVNEYRPAGKYEIEFIVGQDSNPDIASGVYFYQLKSGNLVQTRKMVLIK